MKQKIDTFSEDSKQQSWIHNSCGYLFHAQSILGISSYGNNICAPEYILQKCWCSRDPVLLPQLLSPLPPMLDFMLADFLLQFIHLMKVRQCHFMHAGRPSTAQRFSKEPPVINESVSWQVYSFLVVKRNRPLLSLQFQFWLLWGHNGTLILLY